MKPPHSQYELANEESSFAIPPLLNVFHLLNPSSLDRYRLFLDEFQTPFAALQLQAINQSLLLAARSSDQVMTLPYAPLGKANTPDLSTVFRPGLALILAMALGCMIEFPLYFEG